jgi:hypothetical protein
MLAITPENVAIGRIIAGSLYLAFPRPLVWAWTGTEDRRINALGRAIGARDLALGVGALVALRRDVPARGWFEAALLSDAADAVATLLAFRHLPRLRRWLILAAAVTGASASQFVAKQQDARSRRPETAYRS